MAASQAIATMLLNRVNDLQEGIEQAMEGLGDSRTIYPAQILAALEGLKQTTKAIADIVPLIEGIASPLNPRHTQIIPPFDKD